MPEILVNGTDTTWYKVTGEIVGWLARDDDDDLSTAVVLVHEMKGRKANHPYFRLRWIHNDLTLVGRSDAHREDEDAFALGDIIEFVTSDEEQASYASWQ